MGNMKASHFFGLLGIGLAFWMLIAACWILSIDRDVIFSSPGMKAGTEPLADGSESSPANPELSVAVESLSGEESVDGTPAIASPSQGSSPESSLPPTPAMAYVESGLPKAVRERYQALSRNEQEIFADAAMGHVQRHKEAVNAWWAKAKDMSDAEFLQDDTLCRIRLQLTKDLEALLPPKP